MKPRKLIRITEDEGNELAALGVKVWMKMKDVPTIVDSMQEGASVTFRPCVVEYYVDDSQQSS